MTILGNKFSSFEYCLGAQGKETMSQYLFYQSMDLPISGLGFGLFSTTKIGFGTYCGGGLKIE